MEMNIRSFISIEKCWDYFRKERWGGSVCCAHCGHSKVNKNGCQGKDKQNQSYECKSCKRSFNDLTNSIFAHSNEGLDVWFLCLYFMGLNLSNQQIAKELDISEPTAQKMTIKLRSGIVKKKKILS